MLRVHLPGRRLSQATLLLAAIGLVALLILIGSRIRGFVHIFGAHAGIAITQEEVELAHNSSSHDGREQVVPKIIHQIFHNWKQPGNETLPADWEERRQSCVGLHPDWEYRLWTEKASHAFLATEYPWFLPVYDSYAFPVQRVDSLRYFLMRHYGGIYIDLDNGCTQSLEPLLYYPCWITDGGQGALSNNILAARPGHPFWAMMTDKLVYWGWNYGLPYVTISWASGQWFLTQMWEKYHAKLGLSTGRTVLEISGVGAAAASKAAKELDPYDPDKALYRVMMDMREGAARWVFFDMGRGETWRNWDNYVFMWIGGHLLRVVLGGVLVAAALLGSCWACIRWRTGRYRRKGETRGNGYVPVREDDVELLHSSDREA